MGGMSRSIAILIGVLVLTALSMSRGLAQTPSPFAPWQNDSGIVLRGLGGPVKAWSVVVGGGAVAMPESVGSKHYEVEPAPVIDIRYKDWAFLTTGEGLGVNLLRGPNYRAGLAVGYDTGRSQHDERALNGTGSIPPAPVIRAFGEFSILPFIAKIDVQQALGGVDGLWGDVGVYAPVIGNKKLVVFVGPSVTLANGRYMQRTFGVGTTQATPNSQFPPYRARAGFTNANFGVAATYRLTDHWLLDADLAYERLLASAADSPLVASANQIGAAVTGDYEF
jgi:outer membrane scaffolding protein for murein synthesis (MipA/OmpV family)